MSNYSSNIPQKPIPKPEYEPEKPKDTRPRIMISSLSENARFEMPDEDEELVVTGVVLSQSRAATRVKFDPKKPNEYTYPTNIAPSTLVIAL